MIKFLSALFKRPAAKGLEQYDDEYVSYCIEQEQTVSELESALHTSDNPNEIALQTLKTVCTFYDADWAGLLEVDLELGVTTTGWQYHAESKPVMSHKTQEFENIYPMTTWLNALKSGEPIIVLDLPSIAKALPQEYQAYKRMGIHSLIAVPFGPTPLGFLVLKNPARYRTHTSAVSIFAYVLHRAIAQRNAIERAKMVLTPKEIRNDNDVIINFFGYMEITTKDGVWREQDFNSPKCSRAIAYIILQGASAHSAFAIADALYPEDTMDVETINKNIRGYIYRFRKSFELISKHNLIEYTSHGYKVNPALNIKTDLQQFDDLWEQAQQVIPLTYKVYMLKRAIKLYKGSVFETACDDHWLVGIATAYKLKYISIVNELLSIMAEFNDYDGIHHFALKAIKMVPENIKAHYWLIYSMYHSGAAAIAEKEIGQAKLRLTEDEFATLKKYILNDPTLPNSRLFDES